MPKFDQCRLTSKHFGQNRSDCGHTQTMIRHCRSRVRHVRHSFVFSRSRDSALARRAFVTFRNDSTLTMTTLRLHVFTCVPNTFVRFSGTSRGCMLGSIVVLLRGTSCPMNFHPAREDDKDWEEPVPMELQDRAAVAIGNRPSPRSYAA